MMMMITTTTTTTTTMQFSTSDFFFCVVRVSPYEKGNKKREKVMLLRDDAKKSVGQK